MLGHHLAVLMAEQRSPVASCALLWMLENSARIRFEYNNDRLACDAHIKIESLLAFMEFLRSAYTSMLFAIFNHEWWSRSFHLDMACVHCVWTRKRIHRFTIIYWILRLHRMNGGIAWQLSNCNRWNAKCRKEGKKKHFENVISGTRTSFGLISGDLWLMVNEWHSITAFDSIKIRRNVIESSTYTV